ncbi:MAG: hypothetical protein AAFQ82_24220 [Myxococcota bacterium]
MNGGYDFEVIETRLPGVSHPVVVGDEIWIWQRGTLRRTSDGVNFSSTSLSDPNLSLWAIAYDPVHRSFAAVNSGYAAMYGSQRWYQSEDGVDWKAAQHANDGHPIKSIAFSYLSGNVCP